MDADGDDDGVEYEPESFEIGAHTFSVTTIAFLPIEVLMANQSKEVEISGQKLWCGSLAVAEFIMSSASEMDQEREVSSSAEAAALLQQASSADHPSAQRLLLQGATVVELGAGTGVLGMLCRRLGAGRVVLTDNDVRSLKHMKLDCARNNVEAAVMALDWFTPDMHELREIMTIEGHYPPASSVLVVAGDVLYKRCLLDPFFSTARNILALPIESSSQSSQMVLCHVPRAGVEQTDVVAAALRARLSIFEVDRSLWLKGACVEYCPTEDADRAVVYRINIK